MTGESQVVQRVSTTVLPRDDMLDMEGEQRVVGFVEPAVFAAPARSPANRLLRGRIHHEPFCKRAWAFAWRMATIAEAMT